MPTPKRKLPIVEVMTGIIMVVIILTFGLPRYLNWLQESKIGDVASRMLEDLRVARSTAVQNRHKVIVSFNAAASRYTVHEDVNGNGTYDSEEPRRRVVLGVGIQYGTNAKLKVPDIWGHELLEENPVVLVGGGKQIIFNTQGQASKSGALYLVPADDAGIRNDHMRAIRIIRTTGDTTIMRYDQTASPPWK